MATDKTKDGKWLLPLKSRVLLLLGAFENHEDNNVNAVVGVCCFAAIPDVVAMLRMPGTHLPLRHI